jgi:hypothetical protein
MGVYFVLDGELAVNLKSEKEETTVLNRYRFGQSCADPELNLTAPAFSEIK